MQQQIRCCIRGKVCKKTPEEAVRQALLSHLITSLDFPKGLCVVESTLKSLYPLLGKTAFSNVTSSVLRRRVDITFFRIDKTSSTAFQDPTYGNITPFIIFECKATKKIAEKRGAKEKTTTITAAGITTKNRSLCKLNTLLQVMGYAHHIAGKRREESAVPYFAVVDNDEVTLYRNKIIKFHGNICHFPSWEQLINDAF